MKLSLDYCSSAPREYRWTAIDDDTYDGASDSSNRHQIGYGATEQEAIRDLLNILADDEEAEYEQLRRETEEADQRAFERTHAWGRS